LSEKRRKYRKFTGQQKLELVMASLRGEKTVAELCREHEISETLLRRWRDQVLEAGAERLAGGQERSRRSGARARR
jgi:transposase